VEKMHSLLARQLKRHFAGAVPENLHGFIAAVNAAYWQSDDDRRMVERSLELSSQELVEANSQLRALFEALPDLFFHIDHAGKIIDCKTGNLDGFDFSPEMLLGKFIEEMPIPEWREQFGEAFRQVREKKSLVTIECSAQRQSGTEFYEVRLLPLFEDHVGAIIRNITRRKLAEQALEKSFALLHTTLDSTSNGILVTDREGRITDCNQRFVEMWRVPDTTLAAKDEAAILNFMLGQLKKNGVFLNRVKTLSRRPLAESFDMLEFEDGRVFEHYSKPQVVNGESLGRIWSFFDISAHRQAEDKIKATLREKEVLLREIHHRVKNNMQVISSLLSLQAGYIQNPEALRLFKESEGRIRSMALVHEKLYQSEELAQIDFAEYIPSLTNHLMSAYASASTAVGLRLHIEHITLGLDAAIPCGLIINELVSNALKHAFAQREHGDITIQFPHKNVFNDGQPSGDAASLVLSVKDNGVGLPEKFDFRQGASLGLKLVLSLVRQLRGKITHQNRNGAEFRIEFKQSEKSKRKVRA